MPNNCLKSVIPSLPVEVTLKINNKNTRATSIQIILVSLLLNFEHIQKTLVLLLTLNIHLTVAATLPTSIEV